MSNCIPCQKSANKDERLIQLAEQRGRRIYAHLDYFTIYRMVNGGYTVKSPTDEINPSFELVMRVYL